MFRSISSLLLSPRGRIGRSSFLLGLVVLLALSMLSHYTYPLLDPQSLWAFYIPMIFFFLILHVVMCVFGKRLHDLGKSQWALIALFSAVIISFFVLGLKYGMLEYVETVNTTPGLQNDPEAMRAVLKAYNDQMAANVPIAEWILAVLPALFTAWLALTNGEQNDNQYGAPAGR